MCFWYNINLKGQTQLLVNVEYYSQDNVNNLDNVKTKKCGS